MMAGRRLVDNGARFARPESRAILVHRVLRLPLDFGAIPLQARPGRRPADRARSQMPSVFCDRHYSRVKDFPAVSKNESLQLQWFRQTLRAHNGKWAVDSIQGKDRSDDQKRAHRCGEVKIMGFGNFRVVKRAAREGRDPRTGAPVKIKAAKRPRFSAGKGLKDAVNR
jgi:DNA-binding protein